MNTVRLVQQGKTESGVLSAWGLAAGHLVLAAVIGVLNGHTAYAQPGTVVTTTLTSPSLEGNAWGDPATRQARVYLPRGYDSSSRRYPVAYYLHGGIGDENSFFSHQGKLIADLAIAAGAMQEMIVVGIDASNSYGFSYYYNSPLLGDYEHYVARDLVDHIDANFRTISDRDSRGVFGHSSGGEGAMWLGMMHSDVFGAVYSTAAYFFTVTQPNARVNLNGETAVFSEFILDFASVSDPAAELASVQSPADLSDSDFANVCYTLAAFQSPNLDKPNFYVDLPFELPSLEVIPEVRNRWLERDHFQLLEEYASDLSSLRGLALDAGNRDQIGAHVQSELFHQALRDADVPHHFEIFNGVHGTRRFRQALTFLSAALIVPEPSTWTVLLVSIGLTILGSARSHRIKI